jgi:hypothetical protein
MYKFLEQAITNIKEELYDNTDFIGLSDFMVVLDIEDMSCAIRHVGIDPCPNEHIVYSAYTLPFEGWVTINEYRERVPACSLEDWMEGYPITARDLLETLRDKYDYGEYLGGIYATSHFPVAMCDTVTGVMFPPPYTHC